jgi:AcrR family transcriptional regulator
MARLTAEAKEAVRSRLLETAAHHFAEHGFDRTNVDAVSLAAGCAKGTLYNYFRSKEDLFGAVIEEAARLALARAEALDPESSVRDRLLALARADVEVLRDNEPFTKVLVREAMSFRSKTYPLIVEHLAPFIAVVEKVLRDGITEGQIRSARSPAELALLYTGMLSLFYVQHWGSSGAWPVLEDIPEMAADAFLYGATGPRAAAT